MKTRKVGPLKVGDTKVSDKKPKRILGVLEGKGKITFGADFKITVEAFLGSALR